MSPQNETFRNPKNNPEGPLWQEHPSELFDLLRLTHQLNKCYKSYKNMFLVCVFVCARVCAHSPFEVHVSEAAGPQKVRAWGPGLEIGMVGKSADFVVEAIGTEVGTLGTSRLGGAGLVCVTCVRAASLILLRAVKRSFL